MDKLKKDKRVSGEWFDLNGKDLAEIIKYGARYEHKDYLINID